MRSHTNTQVSLLSSPFTHDSNLLDIYTLYKLNYLHGWTPIQKQIQQI